METHTAEARQDDGFLAARSSLGIVLSACLFVVLILVLIGLLNGLGADFRTLEGMASLLAWGGILFIFVGAAHERLCIWLDRRRPHSSSESFARACRSASCRFR